MRTILCSYQQGTLAKERIALLETALRRSYGEHFGANKPVLVIWCEVPRGQGFTEGAPSRISWLMVEVADGLEQSPREQAMVALAECWAGIAGVGTDQLMITLCDSTLFGEYLAANRRRIRPLPRALFTLRMVRQLWSSRRRDGYSSVAANY